MKTYTKNANHCMITEVLLTEFDQEQYDRIRRREGFEEGEQIGAQKKAIENAQKLLADGKYTAKEISELFQIPVEAFTDKVKG